ncbi:nascent polypeptide-associated complex protein [Candidatus Woesearchaeota archaeon]|nr:nascent polypeptide-associated complex protein [Candidatus Woesearchaeota archaeon]
MIPGMNARQMQRAMKQMGIQQVEVDATEVIIKGSEKDIIITDPQVSKVNMMGQETYQVVGEAHEREKEPEKPEISDDDVKTVVEQAGCSEEQARKSIEESGGDLAEAIINLKQG